MLFGVLLFARTAAIKGNEQTNTQFQESADLNSPWIHEQVIYKPNPPSEANISRKEANAHPIRATVLVSEEALRQYLLAKKSPLAEHASVLLESPYWSLLVAITAVEQSFYKQPITSPYNLWGKMWPRCCTLQRHGFEDFPAAIQTMTDYFREYWEGRRNVHYVEQLNGSYCYNGNYPGGKCPGWTEYVLKIKSEVENL